jgi:hypothetical protein
MSCLVEANVSDAVDGLEEELEDGRDGRDGALAPEVSGGAARRAYDPVGEAAPEGLERRFAGNLMDPLK